MEQVCGINMKTLIASYFPVEKSHCGHGGKESTNSDCKHMLSFFAISYQRVINLSQHDVRLF